MRIIIIFMMFLTCFSWTAYSKARNCDENDLSLLEESKESDSMLNLTLTVLSGINYRRKSCSVYMVPANEEHEAKYKFTLIYDYRNGPYENTKLGYKLDIEVFNSDGGCVLIPGLTRFVVTPTTVK